MYKALDSIPSVYIGDGGGRKEKRTRQRAKGREYGGREEGTEGINKNKRKCWLYTTPISEKDS